MSESGAKGMGESRDPFTAEELYELRREDLNEFTSEDERMPSPKDVWAEETVVLPEIQTMTGYIRQHYEAVLVDEISRRLRYGELCVRHGGKLYRECPWTGPEDYPEEDDDDVTVLNTPIEHSYPVASDQKDSLAKLAEETLLSERSITRYRTKEADDYSVDKVAVLCVGMHLDPLFSLDLMRKAGILLRNTPADLVINAVLMGMHQYSVQEVSRYLKDCGYPRIKNWPDFDKPN